MEQEAWWTRKESIIQQPKADMEQGTDEKAHTLPLIYTTFYYVAQI